MKFEKTGPNRLKKSAIFRSDATAANLSIQSSTSRRVFNATRPRRVHPSKESGIYRRFFGSTRPRRIRRSEKSGIHRRFFRSNATAANYPSTKSGIYRRFFVGRRPRRFRRSRKDLSAFFGSDVPGANSSVEEMGH